MTHERGLGDRAPGSRGSIHRRDRERLKASTNELLGMGGVHSRPRTEPSSTLHSSEASGYASREDSWNGHGHRAQDLPIGT